MKNFPFDPDYHAKRQAELAALTPAQKAARRQKQDAGSAQARLSLGCFVVWQPNGKFLLTGLPPMADVSGTAKEITIFTPEHRVTISGKNLHWLAWDLKRQRLDDLRVSATTSQEETRRWIVTDIAIKSREAE